MSDTDKGSAGTESRRMTTDDLKDALKGGLPVAAALLEKMAAERDALQSRLTRIEEAARKVADTRDPTIQQYNQDAMNNLRRALDTPSTPPSADA